MLPARTTQRSFRTRAALLAVTLVATTLASGIGGAGPAAAATPYPLGPGYWLFARDGGVFGFGAARFFGSTGAIRLNQPMVGGAALPSLEGYWMVASDGGVFSFGGAGFFGSTGALRLNRPIVDMLPHPSGLGYRLVASDGGIFSFGAARFFGSTGSLTLNQPIVGIAGTPSGNGYWLVAADGGIFAFGDAVFRGSTGALKLNQPIVGMAATPSGNGYWLVASDGGIFAFGDARFLGSTGATRLAQPIVGMASSPTGAGYQLVARDGGIFAFGDAPFLGSTGAIRLNQPIEGMARRPLLGIKVDPFDADRAGRSQTWALFGQDLQLALSWDGVGDVPAGAKVLGVEGLTVGQLGDLSFVVESGSGCPGSPRLNLYVDTDDDGAGDTTRAYACTPGGFTKSFNPVAGAPGAPGLAADARVVALDVVLGSAGAVNVDQFGVSGISVNDFRTFTSAGPL